MLFNGRYELTPGDIVRRVGPIIGAAFALGAAITVTIFRRGRLATSAMTDVEIEAMRAELEALGIEQPVYEFVPLNAPSQFHAFTRDAPDQTMPGWTVPWASWLRVRGH